MNHLLVSQQSIHEPVTMDFLNELKNVSDDAQLDNQSNLIGALSVLHCYEDTFDYFANKYPQLSINVTGGFYIKFKDSNVLNVLLENNIGDGTGITIAQAALVASLPSFSGNTNIVSFDELGYFTRITNLPNTCFLNCSNLESIDLSGILTLGAQAFKGAGIKKVNALNLTSASWQVFLGCHSLEEADISSLNLDNSTGQAYMFNGCTNLKKVTIKPHTTYLPNSFFDGCSKLEEIENLDFSELTYIGSGAFMSCNSLFGEEKPFINSNITNLYSRTFLYNTSITEVRLPNCTTLTDAQMYGGVFTGCTNLHTVVFSSSLDTILSLTFRDCKALKSFDFSNIKYIRNDAFYNSGIESLDDMNQIIEIGQNAFTFCKSLTSISFPETLTTCGSSAFSGCSNLTSVVLPNSLTEIPSGMFSTCLNLSSVTLGNAVTSIGSSAFEYCRVLKSITLPSTVNYIGNLAFRNVNENGGKYFTMIINATTPPTLGSTNIFGAVNTLNIYVPDASVEAYKAAWTTDANNIHGMSEM